MCSRCQFRSESCAHVCCLGKDKSEATPPSPGVCTSEEPEEADPQVSGVTVKRAEAGGHAFILALKGTSWGP